MAVFRRQGIDRLCLAASYAHSVSRGDEYYLLPIRASDTIATADVFEAPVRAKVSSVEGLTPELQVIDPVSSSTKVKTGWKAKRLSHLMS